MPPRHDRRAYPLDPALDFLRLLWAIEHRLQRMSKRMEASLGVTGPQRLVLRIVGRFPGLSAGDLAHIVQLHPSTITGILQRLEGRGLLVRERDPEDNRRVRLRLKARARTFTRAPHARSCRQWPMRSMTSVSRRQEPAAHEVHGELVTKPPRIASAGVLRPS